MNGETAPATDATAVDPERPAILRFASDEFMEQILGTLARDPSSIDALVARPETWREPAPEQADLVERTPVSRMANTGIRKLLANKLKTRLAAIRNKAEERRAQAKTPEVALKLYQPAHQRYYLVASSLICATPGFPERALVAGGSERVNFVIRRLLPATPGSTEDLREFTCANSPTSRVRKAGVGNEWTKILLSTLPARSCCRCFR
jgi:hypothetical protein